MRNNLNGKYHLTADIDLSDGEWTPIGTFTGIFDGQGYVIHNLTITGKHQNSGLFSAIQNANIKGNARKKPAGFYYKKPAGFCVIMPLSIFPLRYIHRNHRGILPPADHPRLQKWNPP